jgi:Flp pilus assembly protein TadG
MKLHHDRRGTTALEFGLIGLPFLLMLLGIFDIGRYAITAHSLQTLADANARALIVNNCYSWQIIKGQAVNCGNANLLSAAQNQAIAPFAYVGGLAPTVSVTTGASSLTVTVTQAGFTMVTPFFGTTLNAPSTSVSIPF